MQTAKFEDIPMKTKGVEALEGKKITIFVKAAGNPYCSVKLYVHDFTYTHVQPIDDDDHCDCSFTSIQVFLLALKL